MAKKSSLLNMALVLTLVCLGASAAVAVVYAVTKEPIDLANQLKVNNAIKEVVPAFDNAPSDDVLNITTEDGVEGKVYVAKNGSETVGYAIESKTNIGFGGPFTIMVGMTPDGAVYNTSVISHTETPGLGAKITDHESPFIQQWIGKNICDGSVKLLVKKDGGDIDAITASTITSRAYCNAMENAAKIFKSIPGVASDEKECCGCGCGENCQCAPECHEQGRECKHEAAEHQCKEATEHQCKEAAAEHQCKETAGEHQCAKHIAQENK